MVIQFGQRLNRRGPVAALRRNMIYFLKERAESFYQGKKERADSIDGEYDRT